MRYVRRPGRLPAVACAFLFALAAGAAAGCADRSDGQGEGMSSSTPSQPPTGQPGGTGTAGGSATPGGSPSSPGRTNPSTPKLPGDPLPSDGERTVQGRVVAGVEPGCLLLNSGGVDYLLLGGDPDVVRVGATVTVRGTVTRDMMTTCMQGVPFRVAEARSG